MGKGFTYHPVCRSLVHLELRIQLVCQSFITYTARHKGMEGNLYQLDKFLAASVRSVHHLWLAGMIHILSGPRHDPTPKCFYESTTRPFSETGFKRGLWGRNNKDQGHQGALKYRVGCTGLLVGMHVIAAIQKANGLLLTAQVQPHIHVVINL